MLRRCRGDDVKRHRRVEGRHGTVLCLRHPMPPTLACSTREVAVLSVCRPSPRLSRTHSASPSLCAARRTRYDGWTTDDCARAVVCALPVHSAWPVLHAACANVVRLQFCERVQLDAICSNELGDPDALVTQAPKDKQHVLADWRDIPG